MSKTLITMINTVVVMVSSVPRMEGMMTEKNLISFAPSMRAAQQLTGHTLYCRRKDHHTEAGQIQIMTKIRKKLFQGRNSSQPCGSPPRATTMAFSRPICRVQRVGSVYEFPDHAGPDGGMAIGRKMTDFATGSHLPTVGHDGDDQPHPLPQRRHKYQP